MASPTRAAQHQSDKLLTDALPHSCMPVPGGPLEVHRDEVANVANAHGLGVQVWQFECLKSHQTLQEAVQLHIGTRQQSNADAGPCSPTSLVFISQQIMRGLRFPSLEEGAKRTAQWWRTVTKYRQHWQAQLKNVSLGNYCPVIFRTVVFGTKGVSESKPFNVVTWPAVVVDSQGHRHWGMVGQSLFAYAEHQQVWGLRDLLATEFTPACICCVAVDTGVLLWQNSASMAMFGCHGLQNTHVQQVHLAAGLEQASDTAATGRQQETDVNEGSEARGEGEAEHGLNFLELLFNNNVEELQRMKTGVQSGNAFRARLELGHPTLRTWLGLRAGEEAHHDVQVTLSRDPVSLRHVYIISQTDITDQVVAKRRLADTHAQLQAEKQQLDALLRRQYQLIECLSRISDLQEAEHVDRGAQKRSGLDAKPALSSSPDLQRQDAAALSDIALLRSGAISTGGKPLTAAELIEGVRRQIAGQGLASMAAAEGAGGVADSRRELEILERLGEGSFGKVYRGLWRGTEVAVKCMMLPSKMSGTLKLERMAIMEAAISSSLSHPNVVQTYTYTVSASASHTVPELSGSGSDRSSSEMTGFSTFEQSLRLRRSGGSLSLEGLEVRLVLEYMDGGSLRDALNGNVFAVVDEKTGGAYVNYAAVLETAIDIAKGMVHLHSVNVIHGDLKARNVLLRRSASDPRGFIAKISDFGLSFQMESNETHISKAFAGTTSHMAPEVLLDGRQSKATDVYAFGVTLFELYTAAVPFHGVPQVLLAYQVATCRARPAFPPGSPPELVQLADSCWQAAPADRPSFAEVLDKLKQIRAACNWSTPAVQLYYVQQPPASGQGAWETDGSSAAASATLD